MPALDQLRMGEELGGWDDQSGRAAQYQDAGSDYRTYKPSVSNTPEGGLLVSTKIDHIRGGDWVGLGQDDHCLLTVKFDSEGEIVDASATMKFADIPRFDPVLVEKAVVAAGQAKYAAAAKVAAEVANSLAKFITNITDHGGRLNFPAVVQRNINIMWKCVAEDPAKLTPYEIRVVTGQLEGAGTDATVYIILFGEYGNSGQFELDNPSNNFERGKTDTFVSPPVSRPDMKDLGDLQKVRVSHDSGGESPEWYLDTVTVQNQTTGQSWLFPCHRWLNSVQGTSVELLPDTKLTTYEITVVTGDVEGAGTNAGVYIRVSGSKGASEYELDNPRDNFQRGQTDRFEWKTRDLGELKVLHIRHDNKGDTPGWFLDRILVRNQTTNQTWLFPCGQWLAVDSPDGRTDRHLMAEPQPAKLNDGLLIKGSGAAVYLIEAGERRWIPDPQTFNCRELDWNAIQTITDADLNSIPRGQDFPSRADGTLLKGAGPAVFLMQSCERRWITSQEVFNRLGLNWGAVQTVSDRDLDAIRRGPDLS
ncbi:MAG: PLAT/LH2 domain-containing protein [Nitrospira sp.]|nr:PLAT/LH2 domain-containing protein [Nitrospira sp.]